MRDLDGNDEELTVYDDDAEPVVESMEVFVARMRTRLGLDA